MKHATRIVTTSWDDGDPHDLRIAEMLSHRGLPGTFYIPMIGYLGRRTLAPADIRAMHEDGFEIGGHTYSHRTLVGLDSGVLHREVGRCKDVLEQHTGEAVTMFCYPNGKYDLGVLKCVRDAGFKGGRTTRMLQTRMHADPFQMPTTLQAFPHPIASYVKNAIKGHNPSGLAGYLASGAGVTSWVELGKRLFDRVLEHGGIWHLYGHSWEVHECRLWSGLAELLDYVSRRSGVAYLTNGEVIAHAQADAAHMAGTAPSAA